ncbi:MAG: mannose-1-phosphate guanylyltransferase [Crocinitomicaceae bacterium]|jgi:mannose-1-phosphate guanylyltransferase|nr:mannose-1-phosphate guanylyltransferase [Crocinitomicaceae bacterium]
MKDNYSIIMAGGIGSRFWPMSTPETPKQFLDILGLGKSLIQMTYERLLHISPVENIYIVTNTDYKQQVLDQLPDLHPDQVLTEPQRKNTAPCIAYAAAKIHSLNPNAKLIVSPADHLIVQEENFAETIRTALVAAGNGRIATVGIRPTRPDTGYGYIEFNASIASTPNSIIAVDQFREKPDLTTAESFLNAGNFYWNSGIFIWKSETVLKALEEFQPDLYNLFAKDLSFYNSAKEQENVNRCFEQCEDISIDFAVMEHAKNIDVVLSNFDWSDLGTWGSLNSHLTHDNKGNSIIGSNTHLFNSEDCIINLEDDTTAVVDGLKGYIVIQSGKRLMILKKENEQALKEFVKATK